MFVVVQLKETVSPWVHEVSLTAKSLVVMSGSPPSSTITAITLLTLFVSSLSLMRFESSVKIAA